MLCEFHNYVIRINKIISIQNDFLYYYVLYSYSLEVPVNFGPMVNYKNSVNEGFNLFCLT